jgi:hypothetical protein
MNAECHEQSRLFLTDLTEETQQIAAQNFLIRSSV